MIPTDEASRRSPCSSAALRTAPLAVCLLLAAACTRDLALPKAQVLAIGLACSADAQCDGSRCRDGVCCLSDCAATETCAAPGHLGSCSARGLGDGCTADAQCGAAGHCVDGVCCESACAGECRTCAATGRKGRCTTQADNHDDRAKCASCFACFGGTCAPALPGTDPAGSCGAGLVCSARISCGVPQGGACAQPGDCAVGDCLAGACSVLAREPVSSTEMVPQPTGRVLRSLAATPSGAVAVLYGEFSNQGGDPINGELLENDVWLALRSPAGGWRASPLYRDLYAPPGSLHAALVSVGEYYYLAAASDTAEAHRCPEGTCGLRGVLLAPSGQTGRSEPIDPDVRRAFGVQLLREGGTLYAFYEGNRAEAGNRVHARAGTLGTGPTVWSDVPGFPVYPVVQSGLPWTATLAGGAPVLLHLDRAYGSTLVASRLGQPDEVIDLSATCGGIVGLSTSAVPLDPGQALVLVGALCSSSRAAFAVLDPRKGVGARFTEYPVPPGTVAVVPAGPVGAGFALLAAGVYDADVTTLRVQLGLFSTTGTPTWRMVWEPRGLDDLRDFVTSPVGDLPGLLLLSGPVPPTPQQELPPTTLEFVRYQR